MRHAQHTQSDPPPSRASEASERARAPTIRPGLRSSILAVLGALLVLALFAGAVLVLHRELGAYRLQDIRRALADLSWARLAAALGMTVASYLILTLYDVLALRNLDRRVPYRLVALAAFTSYAFAHNLGFSSVIGPSVRYRLYGPLGLNAIEIAAVSAFAGATFALGLAVMVPGALIWDPGLAAALGLSPAISWLLVAGILAGLALYVAATFRWHGTIEIRGQTLAIPRPAMAGQQMVLGAADLLLAAAILHACMPSASGIDYAHVAAVFGLAVVAGVISHVPAGLGVFDAVVLLGLSPVAPASDVLAGLLVFRIVYYLVPLVVAGLAFGATEAARARPALDRAGRTLARLVGPAVPAVLASCVFAAGVVLLFSSATPENESTLAQMRQLITLPVIETSHFIGSIVGLLLLLLAWGLRHRLRAAWLVSLPLLAVGAATAMLRGLHWEEALVQLVVLAALIPSRVEFHRRGSPLAEPLSPSGLVPVLIVLGSALWLGLFSYKHIEYRDTLWWQFALSGDASRFLRATVGICVAALTLSVAHLLAPAPARPASPCPADLDRAASIVARAPEALANLALAGDKALLFHERGDAFLMYGVSRRSWIVLGPPVGPVDRWQDLLWTFEEEADHYGAWPVLYEIGPEILPYAVDLGLATLKIGEEASVDLASFSLDGPARRELRQSHRRAERNGCRFEIVPPEGVPAILPDLRAVSEKWLASRTAREKGFSVGRFDPSYLSRFPAAVVRREGRIIAFANLLSGAGRAELSADLMRQDGHSSHGVMDYLFVEIMLWGQAQGYRSFNLGMAPLSGLEAAPAATAWRRFGTLVYRHGEHFYNFQGLRQYKEKFAPRWASRFVAAPGGVHLARSLLDTALLISGGVRGLVSR